MSKRERQYFVGIGGSPTDTWKEYYCYFAAIDACWELAEAMAEEKNISIEDLKQWGYDDPASGAGVCPYDDDGGFWPNVFIKFK